MEEVTLKPKLTIIIPFVLQLSGKRKRDEEATNNNHSQSFENTMGLNKKVDKSKHH